MRAWLALCLLAAAAGAGDYEVVELRCPKKVLYRVQRDLDHDGIDDILMVAAKEAWLWRGRKGALNAEPDARMKFPKATALFDIGPPGAQAERLTVRTARGYWALGEENEKLPHASGPGLPARPGNILWRGFFLDFDRDGQDDFIDVSLDGYAITFGGGGAVTLPPLLTETVDTRADAASERLVARYGLGDWTAGDFNGDGRADFAVMTKNGLLVYEGDEKGRFDPARVREIALEETLDADLEFLDFNGDARTDVLAVRRKAGKATVIIASKERGLLEPHRIRFAIPGELRSPAVADLDGDGRPDLALPYTSRPSVQAAVRAVARGEAILNVPIFLNRGGQDCFGALAEKQIAFPIRLRIRTDSAGRIQLGGLVVVEYGGDLDGDGRNDLLITAKPTRLGLHRGLPEGVFEDEASQGLEIPDCSSFDSVLSGAADVNGDGRSDIILLYHAPARRPDRLYVLLSRKK